MKRWICGVLLTLGAYGSAFSQVVDMQKLESDFPKLEQRQDLNGEPCAVIKVVTDDNSMTFDGNVIGAPLRKANALFVYMTGGSKQLRIKSSKTTPFMCLIREKVVTFRMVKLNLLLSIFCITK